MDSECSNCDCPPNTFPQQQIWVVYFCYYYINVYFNFEHANFSTITSYLILSAWNSACFWEPKLNITLLGMKNFGKGIFTGISLLQIWFLLKVMLFCTISNLILSYIWHTVIMLYLILYNYQSYLTLSNAQNQMLIFVCPWFLAYTLAPSDHFLKRIF